MGLLFTKFCGRAAMGAMEMLAVCAVIVAAGLAVLVWRLNTGPVDVSFARSYVIAQVKDSGTGYGLDFTRAEISWPDLRGPVRLRLSDVDVLRDNRPVVNVGTLDLGLSRRALILGQVAPVAIVLDGLSLRFLRTADNEIVFSLQDAPPPEDPAEDEGDNGLMTVIRTLAGVEGMAGPRSPINRLRMLEIRNARMVMEDYARGITWFLPDIDLLFVRERAGLLLTAEMMLPSDPETPSQLVADIAYNRERDDFSVNLDLLRVDPQILAGKFSDLAFLAPHDLLVSGELRAVLNGDLQAQNVTLALQAEAGSLYLPDLYAENLDFDALRFAGSYDRAAQKLIVTETAADLRGVRVMIGADLDVGADMTAFTGPVRVSIPELPQDTLAALWPDAARDAAAAEWLTAHITGGRYTDITAQFMLAARKNITEDGMADWGVKADDITASLAMHDTHVDYRAPLPAAEKVAARGVYENDTLTVTIDSASIAGMDVVGAQVKMTDMIFGEPGMVDVNVDLNGTVGAVFDYIKQEPIAMNVADVGIDRAATRGNAALAVHVAFPALKDLPAEKVKVNVTGTLTETFVPNVVKGLPVTGGPFALVVDADKLKLSGKGALDGHAVDFTWDQYFSMDGKPWSGQVEAAVIANKALRDKMGVSIDDWVEGDVPVNLTYTDFGKGRAEIAIRADLQRGVVKVAPFSYAKPAGQAGSATADVFLQDGELREIRKLTVTTPELQVDNARLSFRTAGNETELVNASFPRAVLGESDMTLAVEASGQNALKVTVTGAVMDAVPFLNRDNARPAGAMPAPHTGPAIIATVNVARMRTHAAGRSISNAKLFLDMSQNGDINRLELDASAGRGALYMRLRPDQNGVMGLRLEADDAGATMHAFGVYDNVRGGRLVMNAAALDPRQPRRLVGKAQLTNFRAVNAPVLARLVGAISPLGLAELLGSDGISFERLEAGFEWHMRKQGDLYVVKDGRTSGSSLGLTFEGQIDRGQKAMDITGHVVPVSTLNSFVSNIPILGTILSGGSEGGVFAATYTIRGPQDKPTVAVNPLSMLTPGILRRLLFESD